jgi:hypothetical protein
MISRSSKSDFSPFGKLESFVRSKMKQLHPRPTYRYVKKRIVPLSNSVKKIIETLFLPGSKRGYESEKCPRNLRQELIVFLPRDSRHPWILLLYSLNSY